MSLSCPSRYRSADATGRLFRILGAKWFKALQRSFGGKRIWIPKSGARLPCSVCRQRDRCIRIWKQRGVPIVAISRHLGISRQSTYRILSGRR